MSARAQVSWKVLEKGAAVRSSDGQEVARVREVAGDVEADIFHGLVIGHGTFGSDHFLPAERVVSIWPDLVEVAATAEEITNLPQYEEPLAERWVPGDSVLARVRRFFGGR